MPSDPSLLYRLARRRNPRRSLLVVSTVLAKHIPVDANIVLAAGRLLAEQVATHISDSSEAAGVRCEPSSPAGRRPSWTMLDDPVTAAYAAREVPPAAAGVTVLGFCETAIGLGAIVADTLVVRYVHSTRYPRAGQHHLVEFVEAHSHAPNHVIAHDDVAALDGTGPLVLVDDEMTTGATALAAIEQIHARWPRACYVVAALLDWRGPGTATFAEFEERTGSTVTVVSLHHGDRDDLITPDPEAATEPDTDTAAASATVIITAMTGVAAGTPFAAGSTHSHDVADRVAAMLVDRNVDAVIGVEECMFVPILVAARLGTTVQSTTLSPVVVADADCYPIRSAVMFPSPCGTTDGYVYNVAVGARVAVIADYGDPDAHEHMAAKISLHTGQPVELILTADAAVRHAAATCAHASTFGRLARENGADRAGSATFVRDGAVRSSYCRDDVEFVIADLGDQHLETSLAEREARMQSGGHYSEMLPIEYVPSEAYQNLFHEILATSAEQVAFAVAITAERIMSRHADRDVVIASLARAGTPIGVLLVRYWRRQGRVIPHYTLSMVRGKGIDELAVAHIRDHHRHAAIQFVDGWTGKGAIAAELAAACAKPGPAYGLNPTLAVVADPGHVTGLYGTRDDLLLPSACLNSTVSGLVSRTVYRPELTGGFHGAKFYGHLASDDVSALFIDTIEAAFPDRTVARAAAAALEEKVNAPTWLGRECVLRIAAAYAISDINLVKPGAGETLRVLLRRDPWKIVVRDTKDPALAPILALAGEKHIEVVVDADITYSACGLIKPAGVADA